MFAFGDFLDVLERGTEYQCVAAYDALVESVGQEEASKTWRAACQFMDHCAEVHGDDDCDC